MTLVNAETGEIVSTNSATYWADRIRPNIEAGNIAAAEAIERWIDAGNDLIEAKASVAHGEWLPLLNNLGITTQDASRLASIASNTAIANSRRDGNLPQGVTVLGELAKVDPAILEDAIEAGTITPATTQREARRFVEATKRPAPTVERNTTGTWDGHRITPIAPPDRTPEQLEADEQRRQRIVATRTIDDHFGSLAAVLSPDADLITFGRNYGRLYEGDLDKAGCDRIADFLAGFRKGLDDVDA